MNRVGHSPPQSRPGPFSRLLVVDEVPDEGLDMAIEATRDECAAIAEDIGLATVDSLSARFRIDRRAGGRLLVTGALSAGITQTCVVSLEPFHDAIDQEIDLTFAPAADDPTTGPSRRHGRKGRDDDRRTAPVSVQPSTGETTRDLPDPIVAGKIDLGAVTVEFLVLSLDPYPRKPGVHFSNVSVGEGEDVEPSPFAALERLKDRR